jgi:hypothetical protein
VPPDDSVWVTPYYATYPLMFAAPNALYAWQLSSPPRPDFAGLPPIHFAGRVAPDFIVALGPEARREIGAIASQAALSDFHYELAATIPVYWKDMYRPELYWRNFETTTKFDPDREGVFIFRKVGANK